MSKKSKKSNSKKSNSKKDLQKDILQEYGKDFKWSRPKPKNECEGKSFQMHRTQKFLSKYFTPDYAGISPKDKAVMDQMNKVRPAIGQKGMILFHSVGAGKTCAAISIASNFDAADYTVLWVTRNSLRQVMYQNIFEQICHPKIKAKEIPNNHKAKMAYFNKQTNKKWLNPVSYRTFSNLNKKKSKLYHQLKAINGKQDILKNTLIVVDESHNLSTSKPHGLSFLEKPIIKDVKSLIYNSYKKSGENSVRLLLLTATPGLNGMEGLVNLLNYLTPDPKERLPEKPAEFVKKFLKKDLKDFNKVGRKKFREMTKKYVSFLDRTKDYNMFARKEYLPQTVNLTNPQRDSFEKCEKKKNKKVDCMKRAVVWNGPTRRTAFRFEHPNFQEDVVKEEMQKIASKFKKLFENINRLDKEDKKNHKKTYKHVIFVDEPKFVKVLTSAMLSHGFNFIFQETQRTRGRSQVNTLKIQDNLKSKNKKNFGIFTKGTIHNRNVSRQLVSQVNRIFNERPGNIHGQKIRFLVIDKNYLEGVSFFDVKYFHILTEPHTKFEMEQLVGRVVRTCGHKGLPFNNKGKKKGWLINVMIYNAFHNKKDYDKLIKDAIEKSLTKDQAKRIKIQDLIIKEMKDNAFDKLLTEAIH